MFEDLPPSIKVVEVGPRDGLQNESVQVPTQEKIALIERLAKSGLKHLEVTSFVSPKWIPQLSDGALVASGVHLPPDVIASALVPNRQGYESAIKTNLNEFAFFMSATESHSQKNINKSIDQALAVIGPLIARAKQDGKRVRAYLSVVFVCPYEGIVPASQVVPLVLKLLAFGADEISLGDTIGGATPLQVESLVRQLSHQIDRSRLALHFHDTRGTALVNVIAGLRSGITVFDSSIGGMGGCPYAPGASGNLATEDLVYLMHSLNVKTGIDLEQLVEAGAFAEKIVGRALPGRYLRSRLGEKGAES